MTRRTELVTLMLQTVVNGKVVAASTRTVNTRVITRVDGTECVIYRGKRWEFIKGLVLVTN